MEPKRIATLGVFFEEIFLSIIDNHKLSQAVLVIKDYYSNKTSFSGLVTEGSENLLEGRALSRCGGGGEMGRR